MFEYTPENLFGVGEIESNGERFTRKLRAFGAAALAGLTTAYFGSKVGGEIITDPITILTESLALYHAVGATYIAGKISCDYVLGASHPESTGDE